MTTVDPTNTTPVDPNAVSLTINGKAVSARKGDLIIAAADKSNEFIPRFCYHPRMAPAGMCRQCLVEVEGPRGPMMVVSCMTPVAEGQVVRTDTEQVKKAQEGVLELLLANHPLDCPVCDKGGECPLQDQAFSHGPGESRYVEEKRHYEKPIPISDNVFLDRERCILCDRCTRFADEVAGDALISFTSRGNNTQVMTFPDEPFSSYFSGNTVQICPVGALTAKPYRFKARPWDLDQTESTCTTCSVGCRTVAQSSRDELVRYQGVDIDPVNWGWLCDRGRFNFESVNSDQRLTTPYLKDAQGNHVATTWSAALDTAARMLRTSLAVSSDSVAIIGGARGTNEDAFAWAQLADAVGVNQRDAQLADGLPAEIFSLPQASIDEAVAANTIILLSPDLKEELPVLFLRVRDVAQKRKSKVVEITSRPTGITPSAWKTVLVEPGKIASTVASGLDPAIVKQIGSGSVSVIVGRMNLAESAESTVLALAEILHLAPQAKVLPVLRRGNVRGAVTAGLTPQQGAADTAEILELSAAGKIDTLVLLGSDPLSDVPDADLARRGLAGARNIISIDAFMTPSSSQAHVVLPAAAFGEKNGTTTNLEGRMSNVAQKITPAGTSRPDWMIACELASALGKDLGFNSVEDVTAKLVKTVAQFAPAANTKALRHDGVLMNHPAPLTLSRTTLPIPDRNSYDYRIVSFRKLYDAAVGTAKSPSLAQLAEGASVVVHPLDLARVGVERGSHVQVISAKSTVVLPVATSESVMRGTAWLPFNQPGNDAREMFDVQADVIDVRIEKLA
ncbi:MAG: NADH-quinone oxidoreductase subunit [Actinomycetota bacterium]